MALQILKNKRPPEMMIRCSNDALTYFRWGAPETKEKSIMLVTYKEGPAFLNRETGEIVFHGRKYRV